MQKLSSFNYHVERFNERTDIISNGNMVRYKEVCFYGIEDSHGWLSQIRESLFPGTIAFNNSRLQLPL